MPLRNLLVCLLVLSLAVAFLPADPPGVDEWKYDVIVRKRGEPLVGLVLEEGSAAVRIRCISRKPGKPTVLFTESVPRAEIATLKLLNGDERKQLAERLETLKRERALLSEHLKLLVPGKKGAPRSDLVELTATTWPGADRVKALSYRSNHFHLVGTASAEVMQLAAIHLEQIYAAYTRSLPPRSPSAVPTTVLLTRSLAEYQAIARNRGLNLINPAFYDPGKNQVVCGSNLERLRDELAATRAHHVNLQATLKTRRAELIKVYRGKVPRELLDPLTEAEKRITASEKRNEENFARVQQRLFQRLYHEAFHAYLETFVYPSRSGTLPVWFNEGLAQIFETAIVEVGELRVGHVPSERLAAIRTAIQKETLLPVTDLLRSGVKDFQVAHAGEQQISNRYYLAAWALAYHLTFERRLLGTKALDLYVETLRRGRDPVQAFRDLVGVSLEQFEKDYRLCLQKLRLDGPPPR